MRFSALDRYEVHYDLGVVRALKDSSAVFEFGPQFFYFRNAAVMRKSKRTFAVARYEGLGVFSRLASARITHMTDADVADKSRKIVFVEHLAYESAILHLMKTRIVVRDYARAFLSAVRKSVQTVIQLERDVVAVDVIEAEHSAFFVQFLHVSISFL